MANLTQERNTVKGSASIMQRQNVLNLGAGAIAYKGLMKATDANQRAVDPGAAGLPVMGVVKQTKDNSLGAADALRVELETGEFQFDNAGDIGVDDVGKECFATDNHTVTLVNTNSKVGKVLEVGAGFVEVGVGPQYQT
jgi:hypothetical protein